MATIFAIAFKHTRLKADTLNWDMGIPERTFVERAVFSFHYLKNYALGTCLTHNCKFLNHAFYLNRIITKLYDPDFKQLLNIWGRAFLEFQREEKATFANFAKKIVALNGKLKQGLEEEVANIWDALNLKFTEEELQSSGKDEKIKSSVHNLGESSQQNAQKGGFRD